MNLDESSNGSHSKSFLAEAYAKGVPEQETCLKLSYNSDLNINFFYRHQFW